MKRIVLLLGIFLIDAMLFSCAPKSFREEKPTAPEALAQETQITGKAAWEVEWADTLRKAKKEGKVVIATGRGPEIRIPVGNAFQNKYSIPVEWLMGGDSELSARLFTERRAGIYGTDLFITGGNTTVSRFKPAGVLTPLLPALIHPEVKDPSSWWEGRLPLLDKDNLIFSMSLYPQVPLHFNKEMVTREELSSYSKLLEPRWRSKIIIQDPTITGGMLKWFSVMIEEAFGPILGLDYMRTLVKQEPLVMRDRRLVAQWMIQRKYPIAMNMQIDTIFAEFHRQGIPVSVIEDITPREGGYLTTGGNNIVLLDKAPHPNAAVIFLNWLLSREGQIKWSQAGVKQSTRIDIPPPEELDPLIARREPGMKYVNSDTEELLMKTDKHIEMAREIFGPLLR